MTRRSFRAAVTGTTALAAAALTGPTESAVISADAKVSQQAANHGYETYTFTMVRSLSVSATCIPKAKARWSITTGGRNEVMKV